VSGGSWKLRQIDVGSSALVEKNCTRAEGGQARAGIYIALGISPGVEFHRFRSTVLLFTLFFSCFWLASSDKESLREIDAFFFPDCDITASKRQKSVQAIATRPACTLAA